MLNYTRGQQLDVLKNIGFTAPDWQDLALLLIGTLSTLALAGAAWAWLDRHRVDPWVRQLERLKRALRSLGIAAAPHEAPRTLAARVRDRLGARGEPLAAALDALEMQRYGRAAGEPPGRGADASLRGRFAAPAQPPRPIIGAMLRSPIRRALVIGGGTLAALAATAARALQKSVEVDPDRRRRRRRAPSARWWRSATTAFPTSSPTAGAPT